MRQPRISFLVGGVQKAGTTALAAYLRRHPQLRLPSGKEAHVFDAPDFDDAWGTAEIERRYREHFAADEWDSDPSIVLGDATPIYILHPLLVKRIQRYNPEMKWVLLLRNPVERAYSHYAMERSRANETLPPSLAFVLESWRLRGHHSDFSAASPLRTHSYRLRGDYRRQLRELFSSFDPQQVLLLDSHELSVDPVRALARVSGFLQLREPMDATALRRMEGRQAALSTRPALQGLLSMMMRSEVADYNQLIRMVRASANTRAVCDWAIATGARGSVANG